MMDEHERGVFWWTSVPGPHGAVRAASDALSSNKSVLLKVPPALSWPETMRGVLEESFKSRTGAYDVSVTRVNAADCAPGIDPGRFLLNRYGSPADQRRFRPSSRTSIQDFLRDNGILSRRLLWIYGLEGDMAEPWLRFARGYSTRRPQDGLFVLVGNESLMDAEGQRVRTVDLGAEISRDDVHLFAHFVLGTEGRGKGMWHDYAAAVAAHISGTDARLAARIADDARLARIGALAVVTALADSGEISAESPLLELVQQENYEPIKRAIWAAQIQILFPAIELERLEIVRRFESDIQMSLNMFSVERFGTRITDPNDTELGALVYMMGHRLEDGLYLLYLPDEEARRRIGFLHACRNRLAHADLCTAGEVRELLGLTEMGDVER